MKARMNKVFKPTVNTGVACADHKVNDINLRSKFSQCWYVYNTDWFRCDFECFYLHSSSVLFVLW